MIGLVLVTHGNLARELIAVMEHVVGPQLQIAAVGCEPGDDMEAKRQEILRRAREVDTGQGAILLTDMFGGTPSNLALSAISAGKVEVLAGVNVPLLIKLASARKTETLETAARMAEEAGRKHIHAASTLLEKTA